MEQPMTAAERIEKLQRELDQMRELMDSASSPAPGPEPDPPYQGAVPVEGVPGWFVLMKPPRDLVDRMLLSYESALSDQTPWWRFAEIVSSGTLFICSEGWLLIEGNRQRGLAAAVHAARWADAKPNAALRSRFVDLLNYVSSAAQIPVMTAYVPGCSEQVLGVLRHAGFIDMGILPLAVSFKEQPENIMVLCLSFGSRAGS